MGTGLFWGVLLILIGIGIVLRVVFNINFPLVKFFIAFFFIFIGIKLLVGNFGFWHGHSSENTTIFGESKIDGLDEKFREHNIIFGSSVIDIRDIDLSGGPKKIKINTIFGGSILKMNEDTPVKIKTDAAFANSKLPNGNTAAFGTGRYKSENFNKDTAHLYIEADVVFGSFEVKTY